MSRKVERRHIDNDRTGRKRWFNVFCVTCNGCGKTFEAKDVYAAKRRAKMDGWRMDGQGRDFCPACCHARQSDALAWLEQAEQRTLFPY